MFVEVHMLQSFAPANLNRDDTNNPKDCEFGGVRRARISSQCLKRAVRTSPVFAAATGVEPGLRSKRLIERLSTPLKEARKPDADIAALLEAFVPAFASKLDKDGKRTAVLLYFSPGELRAMAQALLDSWEELLPEKERSAAADRVAKALVKQFKDRTSAPDIALFGRMLAEKPELSLDAACQMAHAISTHRITMEMDFYTAVDDLQPDDTAGAGMMGFTAYNSACFYRYARVDWEQLVANLGGDRGLARRTVKGFLAGLVEAIPTGKQNAFAAHNPPSLLLAAVRSNGMAWSLANAFEKPVRAAGDSGLIAPSVAALDAYWARLCAAYGKDTLTRVAVFVLDPELPVVALKDDLVPSARAWVDAVLSALPAEGAPA
jgi:CRISPR system Cascade subunit CasC